MNQPEKILISTETLQGVLNYLNTRPYGEVFQLICVIQKEATEELSKPPAKPAKK